MVFVIAELGVNWRNLNEADEMIRECAAAGADACKFQAYKPDMVDGPKRRALIDIMLDESAVRYLYWRCLAAGVEFMCTPMYPEAVDMLDPYVKRWKIRHADRNCMELINKCEKTGKPLLVSFSENTPDCFTRKREGINILYCCPEYPPSESPDLDFKGFDGYSCHIPFWDDIRSDLISHLKYLEVHVKRDHYPDGYCPIDNAVSITMSELAELCRRVK